MEYRRWYDEKTGEYIDSAAGSLIYVTDVEAKRDYSLIVTFSDGKVKKFDARKYLTWEVFRPIRNITYFLMAHTDRGTVVWDDELDIAPERLYSDGVEIEQ